MHNNIKDIINVIMAAVALAMGVAVIVLPIINAEFTTDDLVRMLAFATVSLGIFALSKERS